MQFIRLYKYLFIFFVLLSILADINCGYKLVGTVSALPPHIKTMAIPLFINNSKEPGIEKKITQMIKDGFINDGRITVVDKEKADMILGGTLKEYSIKPVAFDIQDNVTEYRIIMKVRIGAIDTIKDKALIEQDIHTTWDYRAESSVVSTESARRKAITEASRYLAQKMVSIIAEGF